MFAKVIELLKTTFCVSFFCCVAAAACEPGPEHGLGVHHGILDVCKNVIVGGDSKELSINDDSPKFKGVMKWLSANLLNTPYFASKIDGKEHARVWLTLNNDRLPQKTVPEGISKIMMTIPLTSQTLGPTFKEKIKELRALMRDKNQTSDK